LADCKDPNPAAINAIVLTSSDKPRATAQRRRSSLPGDVVNDCVVNVGDSPENWVEAIREMARQQGYPARPVGGFLRVICGKWCICPKIRHFSTGNLEILSNLSKISQFLIDRPPSK